MKHLVLAMIVVFCPTLPAYAQAVQMNPRASMQWVPRRGAESREAGRQAAGVDTKVKYDQASHHRSRAAPHGTPGAVVDLARGVQEAGGEPDDPRERRERGLCRRPVVGRGGEPR